MSTRKTQKVLEHNKGKLESHYKRKVKNVTVYFKRTFQIDCMGYWKDLITIINPEFSLTCP